MPAVKDRPIIDEKKLREQLAKTRDLAAAAAMGTAEVAKRGYAAAAVGAGAVGAVGGAAIDAARQILPSRFTLAFAVALLHYASKWYFGFAITPLSFITSAITLLAFKSAGFEWKSLVAPFLFETILPGLLITLSFIPAGFTSIFVILPWWVFFGLFKGYVKYHVSSWLSNLTVGILFIWGVVIMARSSYIAIATPTYVLDQEFIYSFKKTWIDQPWDLLSKEISITKCQIFTQSSRQACEDKLLKPGEAAELIQVQESLETSFTMDVPRNGFPEEGDDFVNQITATVTAKNNLDAQTMSFACGLNYGRKIVEGKPIPEVISLSKGDSADSVVQCVFEEDLVKRKGADFYFNASTSAKSVGVRDFLVVNGDFRESLFKKYGEVPKNRVLILSTEFGPFIRENLRSGLLNPRVGQQDLVQPVIHVGEAATPRIQPPYVFDPNKIYFALYIKNNGPGAVKGIKNIEMNPPEGFAFAESPENCGLDLAKLKDITIAREESLLVAGCNLVPQTEDYGNSPTTRTMQVEVEYDYVINRQQKVDIV